MNERQNMDPKSIVKPVVERLENGWNAADGAAFAAPFTSDAHFVAVRGDLHTGAEAIAAGHQQIFDTIYAGSTLDLTVLQARELDDGVILAHVVGKMHAPTGPLAGDNEALATVVLVPAGDEHRITAWHNTLVAAA
jgi:uncharacterized protein (TIGR02246 family)